MEVYPWSRLVAKHPENTDEQEWGHVYPLEEEEYLYA